jgi:squalene-hopene/tetraprenyl-beta-curcumene cyclase
MICKAETFLKLNTRGACVLSTCLAGWFLVACSHPGTKAPSNGDETAIVAHVDSKASFTWDPKSAAAYLDQRETWWVNWQGAKRDHGTFCISCHTVLPYIISRSALRKALAEDDQSPVEHLVLANVTKRVRLWKEVAPYYNDQEDGPHKAAESRSTEAVLNAFILASSDAQTGKLSEYTPAALANMWGLQQREGEAKGAWLWQSFDLNPWESRSSEYYGASLAAIAVGRVPGAYAATSEIQNNVNMLKEYLQRNADAQSPINRVALLWASTKLPGLLTSEQMQSIINEVLAKQRSDGGWSMSSVALTWKDLNIYSLFGRWKRDDGTPQEVRSDGLATGFIIFVLEEAGASRGNDQVKRALDWLVRNQNSTEGSWTAYSLNKRRDPSSNVGRFMSDAATAFSVLALSHGGRFDAQAY